MQVSFQIQKLPSHSKGWGRLKAAANGKAIIESSTGNEWVSASKDADLAPGSEFVATIQEQLSHGKGRTQRRQTESSEFRLIAEEGQQVKIYKQYTEILVVGARRA